MFSYLFTNYTYINRAFPCFSQDTFKVVCCRLVVCGKGSKKKSLMMIHNFLLLEHNMLYVLLTYCYFNFAFVTIFSKHITQKLLHKGLINKWGTSLLKPMMLVLKIAQKPTILYYVIIDQERHTSIHYRNPLWLSG